MSEEMRRLDQEPINDPEVHSEQDIKTEDETGIETVENILAEIETTSTIEEMAKIEARAVAIDGSIRNRARVREAIVKHFERLLGNLVLDDNEGIVDA
jgi:hypothetical protein